MLRVYVFDFKLDFTMTYKSNSIAYITCLDYENVSIIRLFIHVTLYRTHEHIHIQLIIVEVKIFTAKPKDFSKEFDFKLFESIIISNLFFFHFIRKAFTKGQKLCFFDLSESAVLGTFNGSCGQAFINQ